MCAGGGKASLTLEAAVVFPFITAFFASILFFFRVLQVETEVQTALIYTGRKVAAEAAVTDNKTLLLASAKAYMLKGLADCDPVKDFVDGGSLAVSILKSNFDGENISLQADYRMSLPFKFFPNLGFQVCQSQVNKKWTGDGADEQDDLSDYVYITKEGTAYHSTTKCSYLDLTIKAVNISQIQAARNQSEGKYYPCDACAEKNANATEVYITDYGTVYHTNINCIGLRRTIYMVRLSEVGGRTPCPKCY